MTDRTLIYTNAFLRAVATGMVGVVLGLYLSRLALPPTTVGYVVAAGLIGAALASLAATLWADRLGRRRSLIALSLLGCVGAVGVASTSHPCLLACAACVGMLNGMGRDRSSLLVLDQAIIPTITSDQERTRAFAVYNVCQDAGHALGSLLAGLPAILELSQLSPTWTDVTGYQMAFCLYSLLALASAVLYRGLSSSVEPRERGAAQRVSPATRRVLWKICSLFLLDSLGGGFLTTALLTYFFIERFGTPPEVIAGLFFAARVANAVSHLAAAWLARRIGLVNTMVFTHVPSSLLLITVGFAPDFPVAALLFLLRESLVEMDVPTRQSYVMALVRPEERTTASGVTNLVRMAAWAVAPAVAGEFMQSTSLAAPLFVGAGLKLVYDAALYRAFRRVKPPEE